MNLSGLKRYWLVRVLSKWIWVLGFLPLVLDYVSTYIPRRFIPETFLHILEEGAPLNFTIVLVSFGLLVSAYLVHREVQDRLSSLEAEQASLTLSVTDIVFLHKEPVITLEGRFKDGLKSNGLPVEAIIRANIEVHNIGREEGQLDWYLDLDASELPGIFHLSDKTYRSIPKLPERIEGRKVIVTPYRLECFIQEKDPKKFAQGLVREDSFSLIFRYRTKRVDQPSEYSSLSLQGSLLPYRSKLVEKWSKRGMRNLISLIENKETA